MDSTIPLIEGDGELISKLESIAEAEPQHAPTLNAAEARIKQLSAENQQLRAQLRKIEDDLGAIMSNVDEGDVGLVGALQGWMMDALDSGMVEGSNDEGVFDEDALNIGSSSSTTTTTNSSSTTTSSSSSSSSSSTSSSTSTSSTSSTGGGASTKTAPPELKLQLQAVAKLRQRGKMAQAATAHKEIDKGKKLSDQYVTKLGKGLEDLLLGFGHLGTAEEVLASFVSRPLIRLLGESSSSSEDAAAAGSGVASSSSASSSSTSAADAADAAAKDSIVARRTDRAASLWPPQDSWDERHQDSEAWQGRGRCFWQQKYSEFEAGLSARCPTPIFYLC